VGENSEPLTFTARANQYAADVLDGTIPACKWVKAAAQRHLDDLADGHFVFDSEEAERVCGFAELMPHTKGKWARRKEKIRLELWQIFVLCCIFGWKRKDGLRRFRTVYLEIARKNAKSTLLAVIALYLLACDGEEGAEVYSAATTRDQARIVFAAARRMATLEPEFRKRFGITVWKDSVAVESTDSSLKALSAEANTLDGLNPHGGIVDEFHAHRTREVWDVLETATGARSQPLITAITTAGTNRAGICYEIRGYMVRILNGTLQRHEGLGYKVTGDTVEDDTYFGMVFTLDEGDDFQDEAVWIKANPNLGVSVYVDDLRAAVRKAAHLASAQPNVLTKRFNVWVAAGSAWMDMLAWDRAGRVIELEDYKDWPCTFGLDIASKTDFTSLSMLFSRDGQHRLFTRHWIPEETVSESDNSQYAGWAADEHIITTDGSVLDHERVQFEIEELIAEYKPTAIGYDPGFDRVIPQSMFNKGLPMREIRSTSAMLSEPMKHAEAAVLGGKFQHDKNPAMTWMVSNVVCRINDGDMWYPKKERHDAKIDGAVSWFIALAAFLADPVAPSAYGGATEIVI
jgi:phage terminase large subunit-like protein